VNTALDAIGRPLRGDTGAGIRAPRWWRHRDPTRKSGTTWLWIRRGACGQLHEDFFAWRKRLAPDRSRYRIILGFGRQRGNLWQRDFCGHPRLENPAETRSSSRNTWCAPKLFRNSSSLAVDHRGWLWWDRTMGELGVTGEFLAETRADLKAPTAMPFQRIGMEPMMTQEGSLI